MFFCIEDEKESAIVRLGLDMSKEGRFFPSHEEPLIIVDPWWSQLRVSFVPKSFVFLSI